MKFVFFLLLFFVTPNAFAQEYPDLGVKIETIAEKLNIPWGISWAPDGTIFFTERTGNVRVIHNGSLLEQPILSLEVGGIEGGLLGIALDPNFSENHYIYLYYTYTDFLTTHNKLVRYVEENLTLREDKILLDKIPGGPFHDGGRIKFGPDGKLYITTGDSGNANLAQDKNSFAGKILRINPDGTIPRDNPFPNSPIYSLGHRNPQGLDWDIEDNLVSTEHGPSGWHGIANDEINLITPGANYGWPDIIGSETKEGLVTPILSSGDETWAPSGADFYFGDEIPQWKGKYFVATLRGNHLHMIDFDLKNNKVLSHEKLFQNDFGRLRDVATGPDGYLYFMTSNQDGRGSPRINDDRILRIVPLVEANNFDNCVRFGDTVIKSNQLQCEVNNKIFVNETERIKQKAPDWVKKIFDWQEQNKISNDELVWAVKFLIQNEIIRSD